MLLLLALACASDPALKAPVEAMSLEPIVKDLVQPTDLAVLPGGKQLVVITKPGTAHLVDVVKGKATDWFSLDVETDSEMGLLGIALAPDFATSGIFYLDATPKGRGGTVVSRWKTDPATLSKPTQQGEVLHQRQPFKNHNGGQIRFGPDGMLYVAFGDGGKRADPKKAGQDLGTWLGSILRIDVSTAPYKVPPDNPFVSRKGAKPEIYVWGVRNPWRFDILPDGRLVVADVGQDTVEEISIASGGDNLGWSIREGDRCFQSGCSKDGLVDPIFTYGRSAGQSITGGVVPTAGPWKGRYLFADFGSQRFWALDLTSGSLTSLGEHKSLPVAFRRDADGLPLLVGIEGTISRLAQPAPK